MKVLLKPPVAAACTSFPGLGVAAAGGCGVTAGV